MSAAVPCDQRCVLSEASRQPWDMRTRAALASLTLAVFSLVFGEFLPAGLLTPLASDLGVPAGAAGQAVTATAIGGTASALCIGLVIRDVDRRTVMIALSLLACLGNAVCMAAGGLAVLLVARLAVGIAIGGFWALAAGVVGRLAGPAAFGRAMGLVMAGVSLATIAAPPAGTFIADHLGWRAAFALACAANGLALAGQVLALPRLPSSRPVRLRTLVKVGGRREVAIGLLAVVGIAGGHFAGFTFIRPILQGVANLDAAAVAAALLASGLANFAGNLLAARLVDRHLVRVLVGSSALIGLSALAMALVARSQIPAITIACLWGAAFGAAPVALQTWMARAAADQQESVGSLFIATFQVAIALGAAVGGIIVDGRGAASVLMFTAILTLLAAAAPMIAAADRSRR